MKRIVDEQGFVHYALPGNERQSLCGISARDLMGEVIALGKETDKRVNCKHCAKVVCSVRNECYNTIITEIERDALMYGVYGAVANESEVE